MAELKTAVELLERYGPWFLVVVAGLIIWKLAKYIQLMQDRHQDTVKKLLLDHNKEQKEETKQLVAAMVATDTALQAINNTLNAVVSRRQE